MRLLIALLFFCSSITISLAQTEKTEISIQYNSDYSVLLNGTKVNHKTSYKDIVKLLGEPVVYKEYTTGKVNYHYTELGIALHTLNGKLLFIGVNYNWDGDETFPDTAFQGAFKVGETALNAESKPEIIGEMKAMGIMCLMPQLCMNNPKKAKNPIIIGFEEGLITQVGVEFHK